MAWLAVDKDGFVGIYEYKPKRDHDQWSNEYYLEMASFTLGLEYNHLTWYDEPVEI